MPSPLFFYERSNKMAKLLLEVNGCETCPMVSKDRQYTADSFEMVFKYTCTKNKKVIREYVDWNEEVEDVPKWCPLLV